ncbi:MAG: hypothetical protein HY073_00805 [Deltaproteobacteria bacterium]|nr:hypothetical protein [Deltaproteobacteria bacterium]
MFWLARKILAIGFFAALVFFALQYRVGGRQVKDYLLDFYNAPLFRNAVQQTKDTVQTYLHKDVGGDGKDSDHIDDQDRHELEKVLKDSSRSK